MTDIRSLAEKLNSTPQDILTEDWDTNIISSSFILDNLDAVVSKYGKLFRRKKLPYENGLVLYIYAHPSYRLFELIKEEPLLRECRGIIMSPIGIRNRPFPVIPTISWDLAVEKLKTTRAYIKINGKMITGMVIDGNPICIDKSGNLLTDSSYEDRMAALIFDLDIHGLTPIFELTNSEKPMVLREATNCYLVGIRSRRTGRLASGTDLIYLSIMYNLGSVDQVSFDDLDKVEKKEGLIFNDEFQLIRSKTPLFHKLQKITSIIRFNNGGNLADEINTIDRQILLDNLTNDEQNTIRRYLS